MILLELSYALEDEGAKPATATNVDATLELIENTLPDAAILDVNLGRSSTCEPVADRLAKPGVPFLLHSGDLVRRGGLIARIGAEVISKQAACDRIAACAVALARGPAIP